MCAWETPATWNTISMFFLYKSFRCNKTAKLHLDLSAEKIDIQKHTGHPTHTVNVLPAFTEKYFIRN